MMSGKVNLRDNGILDEDLPTLLEHVFKCLSKNLNLVYTENLFGDEIKLREDIVIPNVICDRFVCRSSICVCVRVYAFLFVPFT